jgi:hypothetical protein
MGGIGMSRGQFAVLLVVVAIAGLVGGALSERVRGRPAYAQEGVAEVVEAREFRVVGEDGKMRIQLAVDPAGGPMLHLLDRRGSSRIVLSVPEGDDTPPGIILLGEDSKVRLLLSVGTMAMFDGDQQQVWSAP